MNRVFFHQKWLRIAFCVSAVVGSLWWGVPAALAATTFQMPMRGNVHVIGNTPGVGDHLGRDLYAVDLTSDNPTVYPVAPGHVVYHGYSCAIRKGSNSTDCYGRVVAIEDNSNTYISIYAHLACDDPFFKGLKLNESVTTDTPIGTMSNTGLNKSTCRKPISGRVHLHFAVRQYSTSFYPAKKNLTTPLYADGPNDAVNIWQIGTPTYLPGLPWPPSSADNNKWTLSLSSDNASPALGNAVTLTAQASVNANNSFPTFQIVIKDASGNVIATCQTNPCTAQVTQNSAATQTYTAQVQYLEPFTVPTIVIMVPGHAGDPAPTTAVTWHTPIWSVGPAQPNRGIKIAAVSPTDIWTINGGTIVHGNGTTWDAPIPMPGDFFESIDAINANDIWAVGYDSVNNVLQTLAVHSTDGGQTWTSIQGQDVGARNNQFNAVAGVLDDQIWAAGYYIDSTGTSQPLIEFWNGSAWSTSNTPATSNVNVFGTQLTAIAVTPTDAWAVGLSSQSPSSQLTPVAMHLIGNSWQVVQSPVVDQTHAWEFTGVAIAAPGDVWAVGTSFNTNGAPVPDLVEHYTTATGWQIVATPQPAGAQAVSLNDMSMYASNDVWAAGTWADSSGNSHNLIKHFDGSSWTIAVTPDPGSFSNLLNGIAATGAGTAVAVGWYSNSASDGVTPEFLQDG